MFATITDTVERGARDPRAFVEKWIGMFEQEFLSWDIKTEWIEPDEFDKDAPCDACLHGDMSLALVYEACEQTTYENVKALSDQYNYDPTELQRINNGIFRDVGIPVRWSYNDLPYNLREKVYECNQFASREVRYIYLDCEKAKTWFGWHSEYGLYRGLIADIMRWFLANPVSEENA